MDRLLRNRFTAVAMIAVSLVLFSLVSAINILNYRSMYARADYVTGIISQHGGNFPTDLSQILSSLKQYGLTAEAPYSTRYFSVISSPGRDVITTNRDNIVSITGEEIQKLVLTVSQEEKDIGTVGNFRYRRTSYDKGSVTVFLDMSQSQKTFEDILEGSLLLLLLSLILVYFIIRILSRKAVQPIMEVMDQQKVFINDAGHELKTPLSIISSSADVLELTKGKDQWTDNIHRQVERLNCLIQDMLTMSRYQEIQKLTLEPLELEGLVTLVSSELQPMAAEKQLKIKKEFQPGLTVMGHEDSLSTLFRILLDNAIRYSAEGDTITIRSSRSGSSALVEVTNPFPDFPEDQLEKIFERFYRADASRCRNTGGSGIGLAMARSVAKSNGAAIQAIKPDNESITFQVKLKLKK